MLKLPVWRLIRPRAGSAEPCALLPDGQPAGASDSIPGKTFLARSACASAPKDAREIHESYF